MGRLRKRTIGGIGRRGRLLILFGLSWFMIGLQIFRIPRVRFSADRPDPLLILDIMDSPRWGVLWVICGIGAVVVGVLRKRKPFYGRDEAGFNLICIPVFVWATFYLISYVVSVFTDGTRGQEAAAFGLILYGLISVLIVTIAGWPEGMEETLSEESDRGDREAARHQESS